MAFERYAIYWAPSADLALAEFARSWLGGDAESGTRIEGRTALGLDAGLVERATASPRRYGVHATLKAPFRMAEGASEAWLGELLTAFAARRRAPRAGRLKLHRFSRYLALVPADDTAELDWLAAECVTLFDQFRAPLSETDRARRGGAMTGRAATHFEQFGYPDIFERFMFHITLAGPLDLEELDAVEATLAPAVEPFTREPFIAEELCLFGDPGHGALFRILQRVRFL